MMTALFAARNILGESHDLWAVNTDEEYHEEKKEEVITAEVGAEPKRPAFAEPPRVKHAEPEGPAKKFASAGAANGSSASTVAIPERRSMD